MLTAAAATGFGVRYFCRVAAVVQPTAASSINFEIWLPAPATWNGKLYSGAGSGSLGALMYEPLAAGLKRGYAAMTQDRGHVSRHDAPGGFTRDGSWAYRQPEKIVDWAHRGQHVATVASKSIIAAFYGKAAGKSYFESCSAGGHIALMEATRYPQDYDGIIAGAPGDQWTHAVTLKLWASLPAIRDRSNVIPPEKLKLLNGAVLQACDGMDGVVDGLLNDPRECKFDPVVLQCSAGDGPGCLTAAQVKNARSIYAGPVRPGSSERIAPGYTHGSELGWGSNMLPVPGGSGVDFYRYWVYEQPDHDLRNFDFDKDWDFVNQKRVGDRTMSEVTNVVPEQLGAFRRSGGKLIQWHGWADSSVATLGSIDTYQRVVATESSAGANEFMRLFLAPGVEHCGGGTGPNKFDMLTALEAWVEKGVAPERIVASALREDGAVARTRPLCAFPRVARYSGTGSFDAASSFSCEMLR